MKNPFRFLLPGILYTALCTGLCSAQSPPNIRSFSILHTNDLHAHLLPDDDGMGGFAALATELRHQREGCTCLYLNAGDLVQGTPVSTIFHGLPVYQIANMLGIDVSTVGNHEFDYGWSMIPTFIKTAHFPVVSANIVNAKGDLLAHRGYVIKNVGGIRIAVIGVVLGDLVGNLATEKEVGPWHVIPVVEAVRNTVLEVRDRSDMIVVLGHIHDEETDRILHEIPEVSIVVAGHDHKGYKELRQFEHRYAVEEKSYGVELGRLDFQFDTMKHQVVSATWKQIPIDSRKIAPAPDVQAEVAKWEAKVAKVVDVPIGEASRRIQGPDLRHLIEQAMAEATGADIGYINGGNVRGFLPQGHLLARHVWNVLPFDNIIVVGTFKGSELPENVVREYTAQSKTLQPDRMYKVATTDFTAANQAAPTQLGATGLSFPVQGPLQRDAMLAWIRAKKTID